MEDKIQRLVNAANSTNAKAKEIGEMQLRELGLDNNGNPLKSASTKETKPKAERKKREPKAKGEPKPKYKVGDVLNHTYMDETYKVKILAVTGWTGDGHRYDIEFLDENLKPMNKFAKSYDDKLSRIPKSKADQPYDCDDLIAKAEQRKAKAKANAIKRASEPKKTQATKNVEAVDRTAERVEKNVEKRVGKGDVSVAEIDKIIAEYETALKKLRALREKATSKMAKGGGVDAEEVEHILMKAQGVKEHHCGCNDKKMATGGEIDYSEWDKPRYLTHEDSERIHKEVEKEDILKNRGNHQLFTKWWYDGGDKIAMKKYGDDMNVAWAESYEDFKDAMSKGQSMAKGGTIKVGDRVKSTTFKGLSGTILSGSKDKDYWFVRMDETLPNGDIQHDVFRKDEVEKIGKGDSMAKGGGVGEKTIVYGKYRNNNTDDSYLFSSESKGLDMLTNHKNIDVISVGKGKYDLFYGWDDDKQKYGTLYFGKWNNGNFGYPYYGKVNYAKGGGVEPMVVPKGDGTYKVINDKWMVVGIRKEDAKPLPEWKQKGMGKSAYNDRLRLKEINERAFTSKERAEDFIKEQEIEKYFTNIKVVPFIEPKRNSMSAGNQTKRYGRGQYEN